MKPAPSKNLVLQDRECWGVNKKEGAG